MVPEAGKFSVTLDLNDQNEHAEEGKNNERSENLPRVRFLLVGCDGEFVWRELSMRAYKNSPTRAGATDFTVLKQIQMG